MSQQQIEASKVLDTFREHMESVSPGLPAAFTEGCTAGDIIWQGDLGIEMIDSIPKGYKKKKVVAQLVPGNTEGSRHCLDTTEGVKMYFPADFGKEDCLNGPAVKVTGGQVVQHPKHGNVTLVAGTYRFDYQREYDAEMKRQRRALD
jgi:hypothetical protein